MISQDGKVQTSPRGSISYPYGAAAMTRRLAEIESKSHSRSLRKELAANMKQEFQQAFADLQLPESLEQKASREGLTLYLSGGGFRGWGYLLMSQHRVSPYPIPIINGFHVMKREFHSTESIEDAAAEQAVFRVSKRRAKQVPAVAFLVNVLVEALPMIKDIRFCQGGVREGFLFDALDPKTKALDPLPVATGHYGTDSAGAIAELLWSTLPGKTELDRHVPKSLNRSVIRALADMMFVHSSLPKESTSLAGMYAPITGLLASAHGVSHTDRALLALMLFARWHEDLPPPHESAQERIRAILSVQEAFWCNYLGAVAALIGNAYPAGRIPVKRLQFSAKWSAGMGKNGMFEGVLLSITARKDDAMTSAGSINSDIEKIEAVGKKKNRIGGRENGYGVPVEVAINRNLA